MGDVENAGNIRIILWDTRAGGSDQPGVHVPRDDRFSGRSYVDNSLHGDRELTKSWQKWERQQNKRDTSIPIKGGGTHKRDYKKSDADLSVQLETLKRLHFEEI